MGYLSPTMEQIVYKTLFLQFALKIQALLGANGSHVILCQGNKFKQFLSFTRGVRSDNSFSPTFRSYMYEGKGNPTDATVCQNQ